MARKILVYWRDIPAQVIVQSGRKREKILLSSRFQKAIDRAAMRAGKGSSDAYLSEWRRVLETQASGRGDRPIREGHRGRSDVRRCMGGVINIDIDLKS